MELINRYVYQIGRRLPKKARGDVEIELRSLLIDALEERVGSQPGAEAEVSDAEFNEADQVAVLKEFGPPAQMADQYQPLPRYIVGPKMYDIYLIVIAAIAGAGLLASIVTTVVSGFFNVSGAVETIELIGRAFSLFFNIFISGVGSVTLVFAILERVIPDVEIKLDDGEWDPRQLPEIEEKEPLKPAGLIAQIAFMVFLLVVFVFFPERINFGAYYDEGWHVIPSILSPAFFALYLPLMEIRWGLTIALNLMLLRQMRWNLGASVAALLLEVFDIYILARLLTGPSVIDSHVLNSIIPVLDDIPVPLVAGALRLAFTIALVATSVTTVIKAYRLARDRFGVRLPFPTLEK
jgi:hypothetical protein